MFKKLLVETSTILNAAGIPYMVIGGQAVLLYGEPRFTRDIDITLGIDTNELAKVLHAFQQPAFVPRPADIESFVRETSVLPLEHRESGIRLDLIFSYTPFERNAIARANMFTIDEMPVAFAAVEDVIILKLFAGRPRDEEDVKSILIKNPSIDSSYIQEWLHSFEPVVDRQLVLIWQNIVSEIQKRDTH